ncbi:MAG: carboxyl transferase [Mogibacterium sp.]|nr:carboxyl transferase [Mogibacterium sp.]
MQVKTSDERTAVLDKITDLLDPGSFMEMGERVAARFTEFYHPDSVVESDGVVTGYGTVNGNLVFIYAQDNEVMGGTFGEQHGRKIVDLYEHAIKAKAPVIGLLDCAGFRIEEGLDGLYQFAKLYKRQTEASKRIPQIVAVIGQCGGGMSIAAQLADFVYIEKDKGSIFVNPQGVVGNAIGDNPYVMSLDDGTFEWPEIVENIRQVIDILPSSSDFAPDILEVSDEELNRSCEGIEEMLGDAKAILRELSDDGKLLECRCTRGRSMFTGFIRIAGMPVGVVACNEFEGRKRISAAGCNKAAKLIDLCTRFHIPLLTITDTEGYKTDSETEAFLPSAAERMLRALTASDVPKFNLVTGSIVGSAYSMMNSKGLGADYVFMWDTANVSIVDPRQATEVIFGTWTSELEQQYRDTQSSAVALARHGFVDKVIAPEDSRKYLIGALQTFVNAGR